jgi:hypothetical protein
MSYQIIEVHSENISDSTIDQIKIFCQQALYENKHEARLNMQVENWQNSPSSLLYLLLQEKRFDIKNGGLTLLMCDNSIIAISGYYRSDFDSNIFIMGVRSWVLKKYRFHLLIAKYLLPYHLNKIQQMNGHTAAITFNEATKSFAFLIERSNKNVTKENKFFFGKEYPEIYKDMVLIREPMKIKNVKQWVLIKKISASNFDWSTLKWKH